MRRRSLRAELYEHDFFRRDAIMSELDGPSTPRGMASPAAPSPLSLLERLGALHALLAMDVRPVMAGRA